MFEYEGFEYTLEEVTKAAEEKNLTVDEYKSQFGLKEIQTEKEGKANGVAQTGATVTPKTGQAPESTELKSEDTFLVAPSKFVEKGQYLRTKEGVQYAEEGSIALAEPIEDGFMPVMLPEIELTAEQYKQRVQQEENETARQLMLEITGITEPTQEEIDIQKAKEGEILPITEFEETQRISIAEKERRKAKEERATRIAAGEEDLSLAQSAFGTLINGLEQLSSLDDQAAYLYHFAGTLGYDLNANLFGEEEAKRIYDESVAGMGNAMAKIDQANSMMLPTQAFYNIGKKEGVLGKVGGGIAAALDGIGSLATSVVSTPAGLGVQIVSNSIKNFNDTKAAELGISVEELTRSGQAEVLTPLALGSIELLTEKAQIKGVGKYINSLPTGARKQMFNLFSIGGSNFSQEVFQYGIGELNTNLAKGMNIEEAGLKAGKAMFSKDGLESGLKGMFGAVGSATLGKALTASHAIRTSTETQRIKNGLDQLNSLENAKFRKNITVQELETINTAQQEIISNLKNQFDENDILVSALSEDQLNTISKNSDFLTESASRINEINASNDLSQEEKNIIINSIESARNRASQEINDIRSQGEQLVNNIRKAKEASKYISDLDFKDFANKEEIDAFLKEQGLDKDLDAKASEQQGFIIQDPKSGRQTIIINREVSAKEKAMNVAAHELGHAILYKTVKDNPENAINLGNALLNELNKIDAAKITDSEFKKRMERYADASVDIQMEEALTLFSDALATGDIKFEENLFTKIGDRVRRTLQIFGINVKFNTGRDVYNFIKDYNKSIEKGDFSLAQVKAAAKGIKGELVKEAEVKSDEQIVKEARSEEASQEVQRIYEEQGEAGAFDIIEQFKPIVSKLVEKRREAPGFDRQLLTDEIETGERGLFDLIREYNPESGVPLAAYINKYLPARAIEASRRVLGEEFVEDVTEAKGVIAEEAVAEVETKPKREVRKPSESTQYSNTVLTNAKVENKAQLEDKITKATQDAFKGQKITRFGETRNIPESVAEIYGEAFGINPQTFVDKKRNYQKYDAEGLTRAKQFLVDNASADYARLPKTKDDFGKGTFIPNNVMNAMYTDGKLTGTLKDYIDLIKEKPTKPIYRDKVSQTIRGLMGLHIRNRMLEDLIPVKAERLRAGAKFSKNIDTNIEDNRFSQIYFAYERGETLSDKDKQIVEDYITKAALEESDKGKSALQFTKAIKVSDLPSNLKEGSWTLSDKKFKEDPNALKEFDKQANDLSSQIPLVANIANKNRNIVLGLFAGHYNIVGSDMAKISSDFKQGILSNLNTDESSVLSEETLNRWKKFPWDNLKSSYASENYTGLRKINESNSFKEQQAIARETFNTKQGKASLELYDLWNTTLQEWLYSSEPGSKEFSDKTNYILKLKKSNASIGTTGERILAPPGYVFLPGKAINGTVKFEHLKSSSQQSSESALLILQNKWKDKGKDNIKAYNGIWGLLDDFNIIDEQTGKVNDSSIFRFAENLELAKSIYSVNSDFTETLYDDIVKKVGEKSVKQFELDQNKLFNANNDKLPITVKLSKSKTTPDVLETMESLDNKAKEANKNFFDSADLDKGFNDILEAKTGIASEKRYKRVKAEVAGASKGKFNFFIPPSAEDFVGLLYSTLSKGKLGDAQMAWYKENLLNPYGKAMNELSSARIALMNDYKQLKKQLGLVPKNLREKVPGEPFTREQAVRVYIWDQQGMEVPGISESDLKDLTDYVNGDRELQLFANQLITIQKGDEYAKPKEGWPSGTITTDLLEGLNTTKRAKYLEQWQSNVDVIFSEENLNKLEASFGKDYRKALENMLSRMKSGRNRSFTGDSLTGRVTDWLTGSVGTIMFFNTRSALLQTISSINFINFTDNNILAAGKAFGNQKQFWSDFMTLMNSDFLKERRGGLRINVNEADIADMAKKGGARGVINKLLEFGFTPTQIADSFAIASGGATFYRNRINTYEKQGLDTVEAEAKAFVDFREIAEESQQSSRPDRISMQQAGPLGRVILAFANTPAQYARLIKKAASDLKNNRGDAKTNISKIIYYGVAQNLLFNALQQALFAFGFGDEEPEDEEKQEKYISIANGMLDSLLRGMGIGGAVLSVGKNAIKRIFDEMEKKQPKLEKVGYELTKISPPISAKLSRINQAARSYQWDKKEMSEKGWSLDNPAYLASANIISALTNIPVDRVIKKTNNVVQATSQDLETWERLSLLGGWQDWEIGIDKENEKNKPQPRKSTLKRKTIKRKVIER